jgi:hypothetical protein
METVKLASPALQQVINDLQALRGIVLGQSPALSFLVARWLHIPL